MVAGLLAATSAALVLIFLFLFANRLPKRKNHANRYIPTSTGILLLPIILIALALILIGRVEASSGGVLYLLYSLVVGVVGFADDVWGGESARGFKGHIGALLRGRVTTGFVKLAVFGVGALVVSGAMYGGWFVVVFGGIILAGSVNLANLFDLRPGRAVKFLGIPVAALLLTAPGGTALVTLPVVGALAGLFYFDLRGRIMLGDAGAALYGAVLGYLVIVREPGGVWLVAAAGILGLTAVAEFYSISRVIKEVAVLRKLDLLGRGTDGRGDD